MSGAPIDDAVGSGYSGKPVWQKLGLKPGLRVRVVDAPAEYGQLVGFDDLALVGPRGAFDFAHVFADSAARLESHVRAIARKLSPDGVLWVSWPKKAAKVPTDITEDTVRAIALPLGLVDVKVCAVDAVWSGLKPVWRRERR